MPRSILSQWAQQLFSARAAPPPGPRDSMQLASNNPPETLWQTFSQGPIFWGWSHFVTIMVVILHILVDISCSDDTFLRGLLVFQVSVSALSSKRRWVPLVKQAMPLLLILTQSDSIWADPPASSEITFWVMSLNPSIGGSYVLGASRSFHTGGQINQVALHFDLCPRVQQLSRSSSRFYVAFWQSFQTYVTL